MLLSPLEMALQKKHAGTNNREAFHLHFSSVYDSLLLGHSWRQARQTHSYPHWPWEGVVVRDIHHAPSMPLCVRSLDKSALRGYLFMKGCKSWQTVRTAPELAIVIETFKPRSHAGRGEREGGNLVYWDNRRTGLQNCVLLWLWGHTCRDVDIPGIHRLWILESLISMLEWLVDASLVFTRTILLRFSEPIL